MWIKPIKYRKILYDKITEKYELVQNNIIDQINKDKYNFTNKLNTKSKLRKLNPPKKGQNQNFENNKQARLIVPTKTELGLTLKKKDKILSLKSWIICDIFCGRTHLIRLNGLRISNTRKKQLPLYNLT